MPISHTLHTESTLRIYSGTVAGTVRSSYSTSSTCWFVTPGTGTITLLLATALAGGWAGPGGSC